MINNWQDITVKKTAILKEAMNILNTFASRIVLVSEENDRLIGTITDGDIRRGLLRGLTLTSNVAEVMNCSPLVATLDQTQDSIQNLLQQHSILAIPIVDETKKIIGLETINSINATKNMDVDVVLMAGGFGKRLQPLTEHTPKPMLPLGTKPILEHIIEDFVAQGFKNFYISTYYKSDIIKDYFKDGQTFGANIQYIEEDEPLGTAGVLYLLKDKIKSSFIVMNADLLVKVNFKNLIEFHENHHTLATMCVRLSSHQVPYGVVELEDLVVKSISEKPNYSYFISAGIYCFNKQVFNYINKKEYLDMPTLFQTIINEQNNVHAFPIHEYWIDIGRVDHLNRAREDYLPSF